MAFQSCQNDVNKSLLCVITLEFDETSLAVAKSSATRDLVSEILHGLVNLMQREIRGLQHHLASFMAKPISC